MALSFMSTCTIEEVASSCNVVFFFQLYICKRREISALMVKRAESNGYKAILLTADTPKLGRREADIKNKMIAPQLKNFEGLVSTKVDDNEGSNLEAFASRSFDPSLSWKVIAWLKSITKLPILIKGTLTREDVCFWSSLLDVGMRAGAVGVCVFCLWFGVQWPKAKLILDCIISQLIWSQFMQFSFNKLLKNESQNFLNPSMRLKLQRRNL